MWILLMLSFGLARGVELEWTDFQGSVGIQLYRSGSQSICSGVLIRPQVILTAAHCTEGLSGALVTIEAEIGPGTHWTKVQSFMSHPKYRGNIPGESVDVGLMFLETSIDVVYPKRTNYQLNQMCERIGFGQRAGKNLRTWQTSFPENLLGTSLRVKDEFGVVGDSGGPVYQREEGELKLIGVHTGRQLGVGGAMLDISYVQLLTDDIWHWVLTTIKTEGY